MFNNHRLSTEHGWTSNQIRLNGILNESNALSSSGGVDEFYQKDPDAPHPHSVDDDRVVVVPVEVAHSNCIFSG